MEEYQEILPQFLELKKEDFLKVFPEASRYDLPEGYVQSFAYAQVLLQDGRHYANLYGLDLLDHLLKNTDTRVQIAQLYGYQKKDFDQQKRAKDIFSLIPPEQFLSCTLYIDHGSGFTEEDSIRRSVYIDGAGRFRAIFQMQDPLTAVSSLRFDPDDVMWREFWDVEAVINGTPVQISPVNSIQQEEKDQFFTLDCQYKLDIVDPEVYTVEIRGQAQKLSFSKIDQMLREQEGRLAQSNNENSQIKKQTEALQCELEKEIREKAQIKTHEEELTHELNVLTETLRKQPFKSALRVLFKKI